jgi:formylglycine-generating enzyme required for sulfatase activity
MKLQFKRCPGWVFVLLVTGLITVGCAQSEAADASKADLQALETVVQRLRGDNSVELEKAATPVPIQENDKIAVEKEGRGLLTFPDLLKVEVFRDTEIRLSEAQLEPGGSIFIRLIQTFGHTRTELDKEAHARVTLETDHATIRALGTEFLVCHAPGVLTCMVTLEGETEVEAQGQVVTVRGGEAVYIFPDKPPEPPIRANIEEVRQWLDRKRGTEEVEALGELVLGWLLPSDEGMARIEGGLYQVGRPQEDDYHVATQEIPLADFWIDRYEVTNAAYAEYLKDTGQSPPAHWSGGTFPPGQENHPIKGVTWQQANDYCTEARKRLPTEVEWEVAARGPGADPPLYPWGLDPVAGGQIEGLPSKDTYEVGSKPINKSHFEVYDMAGNVWEWVKEPYYGPVADGQKVLRGGRHGLIRDMAYRQQVEPDDERFVRVAGFRCAADQVEGE